MEIDSLSSGLMMGAISYRNCDPSSKVRIILTEAIFPVICYAATYEATFATGCTLLSATILPFTSSYFNSNVKWFTSSVFTIGWAATSMVNNIFRQTLAENETSARQFLIEVTDPLFKYN